MPFRAPQAGDQSAASNCSPTSRLRSAALISVAGDPDMRLQCLVSSRLPDLLRAAGYSVVPCGTSTRVLAHAIVEEL
jgi:hypothetical protein